MNHLYFIIECHVSKEVYSYDQVSVMFAILQQTLILFAYLKFLEFIADTNFSGDYKTLVTGNRFSKYYEI